MTDFKEIGLSEEFVKNLAALGLTEPTEIQNKTIPLALAGKDVIGGSATGTGKTLAFGASIIEGIKAREGIRALILTPTRELAEQIGKALHKFSSYKKVYIATVYGGVGMGPQIDAIERADIVVGTPGRILDHMERGTLKLKTIKTLVLDEADRMLDMGFIEDVTRIIEACPRERQTLLFSATISSDISQIAKRYMKSPVEVAAIEYVDASKLEQVFYDAPQHMKLALLVHLVKEEKPGLVMIFCNTRHHADFVGRQLSRMGIDAMVIHGGLTQARRNHIIESVHAKTVYALVCTDVAARGIDIKHVSHVYNYDVPPTSKEYVHRIGRTARAGREGKAVTIVSARDYDNFRQVLRDPSLKIKPVDMPKNLEAIEVSHEHRGYSRDGGRGGRSFGGRRSGGFGGQRRESGYGRGGRSFGGRSFGGERRGGERRGYGGRGGRPSQGARGRGYSR